MALVNMDRWLAEHGVRGEVAPTEATQPQPAPLDPAIIDHIHALEATVNEQARLILDLQTALRAELAKTAPKTAPVPHVKRGIVIRNRKGK